MAFQGGWGGLPVFWRGSEEVENQRIEGRGGELGMGLVGTKG